MWMLVGTFCFGQSDSSILSSKSLNAVVQSNGTFFSQKNSQPLSNLEEVIGPQLIRYSNSWMAGVVGGTIYANKNVGGETQQLWPGPIDTATNLAKSAVSWSKVWAVSKSEVTNHLENFQNTGYQVPESFNNWPSKHNETNVNAYLAPFVDWNKNGVYDPENGDYPSFNGDHAVYFILNDLYGENVFPQANKMGLEMQGMAFVYDDPMLSNAIFVRLFVINRSTNNYSPFYYGQYVDLELGNRNDNYIATDLSRDLVYGYNGDSIDQGGFETKLPSAGVLFLNQRLYASSGLVKGDSARGFPETEDQMLSILEGNWLSGNPKYSNGKGFVGTEAEKTKFIYPGKTEWNTSQYNWRDENSGDTPGVRKFLAVSKFNSFQPKSFKKIDFAFVFALGDAAKSSEGALTEQTERIIRRYNETLSLRKISFNNGFNVYPNPLNLRISDVLMVSGDNPELWSIEGKKLGCLIVVDNEKKKYKVPCSEKLSAGIYLIKATTSNGMIIKKVIFTTD